MSARDKEVENNLSSQENYLLFLLAHLRTEAYPQDSKIRELQQRAFDLLNNQDLEGSARREAFDALLKTIQKIPQVFEFFGTARGQNHNAFVQAAKTLESKQYTSLIEHLIEHLAPRIVSSEDKVTYQVIPEPQFDSKNPLHIPDDTKKADRDSEHEQKRRQDDLDRSAKFTIINSKPVFAARFRKILDQNMDPILARFFEYNFHQNSLQSLLENRLKFFFMHNYGDLFFYAASDDKTFERHYGITTSKDKKSFVYTIKVIGRTGMYNGRAINDPQEIPVLIEAEMKFIFRLDAENQISATRESFTCSTAPSFDIYDIVVIDQLDEKDVERRAKIERKFEGRRSGIVLTNANRAYFIINGQFVLNEDDVLQCVDDIQRGPISPVKEDDEPAALRCFEISSHARKRELRAVVVETLAKGGHLHFRIPPSNWFTQREEEVAQQAIMLMEKRAEIQSSLSSSVDDSRKEKDTNLSNKEVIVVEEFEPEGDAISTHSPSDPNEEVATEEILRRRLSISEMQERFLASSGASAFDKDAYVSISEFGRWVPPKEFQERTLKDVKRCCQEAWSNWERGIVVYGNGFPVKSDEDEVEQSEQSPNYLFERIEGEVFPEEGNDNTIYYRESDRAYEMWVREPGDEQAKVFSGKVSDMCGNSDKGIRGAVLADVAELQKIAAWSSYVQRELDLTPQQVEGLALTLSQQFNTFFQNLYGVADPNAPRLGQNPSILSRVGDHIEIQLSSDIEGRPMFQGRFALNINRLTDEKGQPKVASILMLDVYEYESQVEPENQNDAVDFGQQYQGADKAHKKETAMRGQKAAAEDLKKLRTIEAERISRYPSVEKVCSRLKWERAEKIEALKAERDKEQERLEKNIEREKAAQEELRSRKAALDIKVFFAPSEETETEREIAAISAQINSAEREIAWIERKIAEKNSEYDRYIEDQFQRDLWEEAEEIMRKAKLEAPKAQRRIRAAMQAEVIATEAVRAMIEEESVYPISIAASYRAGASDEVVSRPLSKEEEKQQEGVSIVVDGEKNILKQSVHWVAAHEADLSDLEQLFTDSHRGIICKGWARLDLFSDSMAENRYSRYFNALYADVSTENVPAVEVLGRRYIQTMSCLPGHLANFLVSTRVEADGHETKGKIGGIQSATVMNRGGSFFSGGPGVLYATGVSSGLRIEFDFGGKIEEDSQKLFQIIPGEIFVTASTHPEYGMGLRSVDASNELLQKMLERVLMEGEQGPILKELEVYGRYKVIDANGKIDRVQFEKAGKEAQKEEDAAQKRLVKARKSFQEKAKEAPNKTEWAAVDNLVQGHLISAEKPEPKKVGLALRQPTLSTAMATAIYRDLPLVLSGTKTLEQCPLLSETIDWCGVPALQLYMLKLICEKQQPTQELKEKISKLEEQIVRSNLALEKILFEDFVEDSSDEYREYLERIGFCLHEKIRDREITLKEMVDVTIVYSDLRLVLSGKKELRDCPRLLQIIVDDEPILSKAMNKALEAMERAKEGKGKEEEKEEEIDSGKDEEDEFVDVEDEKVAERRVRDEVSTPRVVIEKVASVPKRGLEALLNMYRLETVQVDLAQQYQEADDAHKKAAGKRWVTAAVYNLEKLRVEAVLKTPQRSLEALTAEFQEDREANIQMIPEGKETERSVLATGHIRAIKDLEFWRTELRLLNEIQRFLDNGESSTQLALIYPMYQEKIDRAILAEEKSSGVQIPKQLEDTPENRAKRQKKCAELIDEAQNNIREETAKIRELEGMPQEWLKVTESIEQFKKWLEQECGESFEKWLNAEFEEWLNAESGDQLNAESGDQLNAKFAERLNLWLGFKAKKMMEARQAQDPHAAARAKLINTQRGAELAQQRIAAATEAAGIAAGAVLKDFYLQRPNRLPVTLELDSCTLIRRIKQNKEGHFEDDGFEVVAIASGLWVSAVSDSGESEQVFIPGKIVLKTRTAVGKEAESASFEIGVHHSIDVFTNNELLKRLIHYKTDSKHPLDVKVGAETISIIAGKDGKDSKRQINKDALKQANNNLKEKEAAAQSKLKEEREAFEAYVRSRKLALGFLDASHSEVIKYWQLRAVQELIAQNETLDAETATIIYHNLRAILSGEYAEEEDLQTPFDKLYEIILSSPQSVYFTHEFQAKILRQILESRYVQENETRLRKVRQACVDYFFYTEQGRELGNLVENQIRPNIIALKTQGEAISGIDPDEIQDDVNREVIHYMDCIDRCTDSHLNENLPEDLFARVTEENDWNKLQAACNDQRISPNAKKWISRILMGVSIIAGVGLLVGLGLATAGVGPAIIATVAGTVFAPSIPTLAASAFAVVSLGVGKLVGWSGDKDVSRTQHVKAACKGMDELLIEAARGAKAERQKVLAVEPVVEVRDPELLVDDGMDDLLKDAAQRAEAERQKVLAIEQARARGEELPEDYSGEDNLSTVSSTLDTGEEAEFSGEEFDFGDDVQRTVRGKDVGRETLSDTARSGSEDERSPLSRRLSASAVVLSPSDPATLLPGTVPSYSSVPTLSPPISESSLAPSATKPEFKPVNGENVARLTTPPRSPVPQGEPLLSSSMGTVLEGESGQRASQNLFATFNVHKVGVVSEKGNENPSIDKDKSDSSVNVHRTPTKSS